MANAIPIGSCLAAIYKTGPQPPPKSRNGEKWKIENREKNRQLERERKDRLVRIISKLENDLPPVYLDKCRSQLKKKTPTVVKTVVKNNAAGQITQLVQTREAKIPQYLILEAIFEYIESLRRDLHFEQRSEVPRLVDEKSCQTEKEFRLDQETQTGVKSNVTCVQTETVSQTESGCQTDIIASVTDSPSKHRSFNIHSLIAESRKTSEKSPEKSGKAAARSTNHPKRIEDGSRSPIQNWQPWAKKQSTATGAKQKPPGCPTTTAGESAGPPAPPPPPAPKNQPKLFSPANDVAPKKGVKRKLNDMPLVDASDLLCSPTKSTSEPTPTFSIFPENPAFLEKPNPPTNHRPYQNQNLSSPPKTPKPVETPPVKKSSPKSVSKPFPLPLPQQKLGVVPRARKQSERDRFNKHRKNDKNVTWSPHHHQTAYSAENNLENNEIQNYSKVEKLFNNINYEPSSKTSQIFDSSFSINSIIPDLNPIAEILQPDNFTNQNITGNQNRKLNQYSNQLGSQQLNNVPSVDDDRWIGTDWPSLNWCGDSSGQSGGIVSHHDTSAHHLVYMNQFLGFDQHDPGQVVHNQYKNQNIQSQSSVTIPHNISNILNN